ncbi:efflux RND transporter periplasmic adaptor subunit [Rhodohalobacter sp. SW132]|uniref:efflux RND transporter periplasmic adaptor subunit n=1 Tax=Rhodohalobacter sp. SW132 TaxID=2293433 RepID=UPI000E280C1E|nr:efflux RND transporter periplasmic adaptor subunit [Rhodohalobacter sp. SW132]REL32879.1 efflux RND transporter periplasmic adaptor subunit [Rhodohalobacter sp. SW132]
MKTQIRILTLVASSLLLFAACGEHDHHDHNGDHSHDNDHDHEYHRITVWEENREWMVKFELHENSGRIEGHLYATENSSAVHNVSGTLRFEHDETVENEAEIEHVSGGKYEFELFFGDSDTPNLVAELTAGGETFRIDFGETDRYAGHPHSPADEVVEFEKERQWLLDFTTEAAEYRAIPELVSAIGRAVPDLNHVMEVISPVDGHIDPDDLAILPVAGERVGRGDLITAISPPLTAENSWVQKRLAYIQAQEAYERAQRLIENNAISYREYQLREREYEARRAGYEHFIGHGENGTTHIIDDNDHLYLKASKDGVISRVYVTPGRQISSGDPILSLYNPDYLWLELTGYSDDFEQLTEIHGIELKTGRDQHVTLDENQISLISRDEQSDITGTRSMVVISTVNRDKKLKANQPVQAKIMTGSGEAGVTVPANALFDEESHFVVFVQHSGDQFERRVVRPGARYDGYVTITEGLSEGERVVTEGVYPLHLATGNAEIGHGHSH